MTADLYTTMINLSVSRLMIMSLLIISGEDLFEAMPDTILCKFKHFDLELFGDSIFLRLNISECQEFIDNGTNFEFIMCKEGSNQCTNINCSGMECSEVKFHRNDCGKSCVMDINVTSGLQNIHPSPCIKLHPDTYEKNSATYPDANSRIKLSRIICDEGGILPDHLLVFNGGEYKRNKVNNELFMVIPDTYYCEPHNLNESRSVAIVEYCESQIDPNNESECERRLSCRSRPTHSIIFNSRIVVCSEYSMQETMFNTGPVIEKQCYNSITVTEVTTTESSLNTTSTESGNGGPNIPAIVTPTIIIGILLCVIINVVICCGLRYKYNQEGNTQYFPCKRNTEQQSKDIELK